jgi:hypothetical protein
MTLWLQQQDYRNLKDKLRLDTCKHKKEKKANNAGVHIVLLVNFFSVGYKADIVT